MSQKHATKPELDRSKLLDEAAAIFLRLRDRPDDEALRSARDRFLAQGDAERSAYATITRAYKASAPPRRSGTLMSIVILMLMIAAATLFGPDLHRQWRADVTTARQVVTVTLASGDVAHLDAGSAVIDTTATGVRKVDLLDGAGFFTVNPDPRPFTVTLGELTATAIGTAFETAWLDGALSVSVQEGTVEVRDAESTWRLSAGDRLIWSDESASLDKINPETVASWRENRLVAVDMTFAQAATVIDRRLPGPVVILNDELAQSRVTGSYDLTKPLAALRLLAATKDASVVALPLGTLIRAPE